MNITAKNITIEEVRVLYQKSSNEEILCKKLIDNLQFFNENNHPCFAAYRACATMIMAKFAISPINKLSKFNNGKYLLEKCIASEEQNIEIRFLRFTVQCNAPKFLGYYSSLKADKFFLLNSVSKMKDLQLKNMIVSFLKSSVYLTQTEKNNL